MSLNLVHVREETEPDNAERLEWFLLTTLRVESRRDGVALFSWTPKIAWIGRGCSLERRG